MPVFRKLPVLVEAIRLRREKVIKTLEGTMTGNPGDWLITGVNGEQYPCKHDIFIQTYEPEGADKCQFCRDAEKCSGNRDGCVFHWKW